MRRAAGIGTLLPVQAGGPSLPARMRIEVDGSTLEFNKKPPPAPESRALGSNSDANAPAP